MDAEPVAADAAPSPTTSTTAALLASLTPGLLHRYATELADLCVAWRPAQVPQPGLAVFNHELARELGWATDALDTAEGAALFAGNVLPDGAKPVAQGYAGHQFGGYSPQLGDGRALLLGEVRDAAGHLRDVAFKGSGRTPFSRGGDGRAAVGP
ncbi:MAG TPA: protein adenylyltransferase SelO family protein, partial [Burkholderiaceae bacterium]|nr:protein adenylyltransferase SelO family protein [Burkholderiaceae bacterium]